MVRWQADIDVFFLWNILVLGLQTVTYRVACSVHCRELDHNTSQCALDNTQQQAAFSSITFSLIEVP